MSKRMKITGFEEDPKKGIKVFGDTAKAIKEGDLFEASIGSVEGRTVVTLVPYDIDYDSIINDYGEEQNEAERDLD